MFQQVQAAGAQGDEQNADQIADPAAVARCLDEDLDPEYDRDDAEDQRRISVAGFHAARGAAATITRHGAFLRTKSTVPQKIRPRRRSRSRRGEPMTMISLLR